MGWRLIVAGFVIYLAVVTGFIIAHGRFPTVDYLAPAMFLLALFMGRGRSFIVDWAPFVVILLAYVQARGLADELAHNVHDTDLIALEVCSSAARYRRCGCRSGCTGRGM